MTALPRPTLRRAHLPGPGAVLAALAFAGYAALLIGVWQQVLVVPQATNVYKLLVYGGPLVTVAALIIGPQPSPRWLWGLTGAVCLMAGALIGSAYALRGPLFVAGLIAMVVSALASRRWPSGFLVGLFLISGTYGSISAFTPISPGQVVDLLLAGLWVGVVFSLVVRRREHKVVLTAGVILTGLFVLASLAAVVLAENGYVATRAFRSTSWHMLAFIVVAYGGWTRVNHERVARAVVFVCAGVGGYAVLRWIIGPAAKEEQLARMSTEIYNQVAGERKTQGSLPAGHQLGTWCAIAIPFCIATAVSWRNRARIAAIVAVPLLSIGLLASANRAAFAGAIVGTIAVLVLNQLARAFRGPRLGIALAAVLGVGLTAALIFPAVVDDPSKVQRYKNILNPSEDKPFQERLFKWENAFADISGYPFGRGMGSAGLDSYALRFRGNAADNVDNAFVQIAYEQGFAMMVFFGIVLLVLLAGLARRAVWTTRAESAVVAIGASGSLAAFSVTLLAGQYLHALLAVGLWVIVGLGLAPFTSPRGDGFAPAGRHA